MTWVILALLARFFWAGSSAVDQMVSRSHKSAKIVSATTLYFCSALPCALISIALSSNFHVNSDALGWILVAACVSVVAILPYYKCLQTDEVHNVVPLFEFTPVYLVVLAFLINGEVMSPHQLLGAAIVIACGFAFSWDFHHGHIRVRTLALMTLSSVLYAFYQFCIRMASDDMDAWGVSGSIILVESLIAYCVLLLHTKARRSIVATAIETKGRSIMIAMLSSGLGLIGVVFISMAFIQAPTTGHVAAIGPIMPFFSFFIAAVLGHIAAKHYQKVRFDKETKIKLLLLVGIFGGIYLLVMG